LRPLKDQEHWRTVDQLLVVVKASVAKAKTLIDEQDSEIRELKKSKRLLEKQVASNPVSRAASPTHQSSSSSPTAVPVVVGPSAVEIEKMRADMIAKDLAIAELQRALTSRDQHISDLTSENTEIAKTNTKLASRLLTEQDTCTRLRSKLDELMDVERRLNEADRQLRHVKGALANGPLVTTAPHPTTAITSGADASPPPPLPAALQLSHSPPPPAVSPPPQPQSSPTGMPLHMIHINTGSGQTNTSDLQQPRRGSLSSPGPRLMMAKRGSISEHGINTHGVGMHNIHHHAVSTPTAAVTAATSTTGAHPPRPMMLPSPANAASVASSRHGSMSYPEDNSPAAQGGQGFMMYNGANASGSGDESELEEIIQRTPLGQHSRIIHRDFDNYNEIGEVADEDLPGSPARGSTPRGLNTSAMTTASASMLAGYGYHGYVAGGRHNRTISNMSNASYASDTLMTPTNAMMTGGVIGSGGDAHKRWSTSSSHSNPSSPPQQVRGSISTPTSTTTTINTGATARLPLSASSGGVTPTANNRPLGSGGAAAHQIQSYAPLSSYTPPVATLSLASLPPVSPSPAQVTQRRAPGHSRQSSAAHILTTSATPVPSGTSSSVSPNGAPLYASLPQSHQGHPAAVASTSSSPSSNDGTSPSASNNSPNGNPSSRATHHHNNGGAAAALTASRALGSRKAPSHSSSSLSSRA
jgi:hypothetical protein